MSRDQASENYPPSLCLSSARVFSVNSQTEKYKCKLRILSTSKIISILYSIRFQELYVFLTLPFITILYFILLERSKEENVSFQILINYFFQVDKFGCAG